MPSAPPDVPTPFDDLRGSSLLAVFAHPDDESLACGGLLAWCAERGVQVSLLCLTRGEHGPGGDKEHSVRLRDVRERELKDAARVLGIRDVVLLDHEDGMLPWIDGARLEADILGTVRRFQPEIVVTFDRDGLYWHPDHIAVHERTTAVIAGLGSLGPALRYVSMPAGTMHAVVDAASQHGDCGDSSPRPILGVPDADAFGSLAPAPTLVVEVGAFAGRKLAALRCHRTQFEGSAFECLDERDVSRLLGTEHYRSAEVGSPDEVFLDRFGTLVTCT